MGVRQYSDRQILDRVRALPSFRGFPQKFWLVGVRSDEDAFNRFDDKFYLFKGEQFIHTWRCTTNAGTDMLNPTNPRGEAVLKSDGIYYDSHERRLHRGKVLAYCQRIPLPLHRDADRDRRTEELGIAHNEIVGINIHPASYIFGSRVERETIQGWSQGCQVFAIRDDFDDFMKLTDGQSVLTYCLLKEWTPAEHPTDLTDREIDDTVNSLDSSSTAHTDPAGSKSSPQEEPAPPAVVPAPEVDPEASAAGSSSGASDVPPGNDPPPPLKDRIVAGVDDLGSKFNWLKGTLDTFGVADPLAKTSPGTWFMLIIKIIFAAIMAGYAFFKDNIEWIIPSVLILGVVAWLLNKSRKRVAEKQAGVPAAILEEAVKKA